LGRPDVWGNFFFETEKNKCGTDANGPRHANFPLSKARFYQRTVFPAKKKKTTKKKVRQLGLSLSEHPTSTVHNTYRHQIYLFQYERVI